MHRRALPCAIALVLLPACATGARQASTEAAASTGSQSSDAVSMPKILPAFPEQPYLDLGPLVTATQPGSLPSGEQLLVFGGELHADALVLETRSLGEVYSLDVSRQAKWRDNHPGLSTAADVVRFLVTGNLEDPTNDEKGTQRAYYRAIRKIDQIPASVDVAATPLDADLRAELSQAKNLQEQLDIAHGLFAAGLMDLEQYLEARRTLMRLSDTQGG